MLRFEWPESWAPDIVDAIKLALQTTIRTAMSNNPSDLVQGMAVVDDLDFGHVSPIIALSSIRELSPSRTAIVVSVKYSGDATIALRGLRINLDTTMVSESLFTLEMRLVDLVIDGNILVEVSIEAEDIPPPSPPTAPARQAGSSGGIRFGQTLPTHVLHATCHAGTVRAVGAQHGGIRSTASSVAQEHSRPGSPVAPNPSMLGGFPSTTGILSRFGSSYTPTTGSSFQRKSRPRGGGMGLLFGGGGRVGMRHPDTALSEPSSSPARGWGDASFSNRVPETSSHHVGVGGSSLLGGHGASSSSSTLRFMDVVQGRARISSKTLRLQFFGDLIRSFRVDTNLAPLASNEIIEGILRNLIAPAIDRLKTDGITMTL